MAPISAIQSTLQNIKARFAKHPKLYAIAGIVILFILKDFLVLVLSVVGAYLIWTRTSLSRMKRAGIIVGILVIGISVTSAALPKTFQLATRDTVATSTPEPSPQESVLVSVSASPSSSPSATPKPDQPAPTKTAIPQPSKSVPTPTSVKTPTPVPVTNFYTILSVTDGDTFKVSINGTTETLRMIGMDTPETVDPRKPVQCFGVEASNRAKQLLTGKKVRLEADSTQGERDKYGRLLRYAYLEDGTFFNKSMILEGYAHEYTYDTKYKYQAEFKAAQAEAQASKRGLWADNACQVVTTPTPAPTGACGAYCTSSHFSAKYYYCENDPGWRGLTPAYLKSFPTAEALLAVYNRTLHDASLCH